MAALTAEACGPYRAGLSKQLGERDALMRGSRVVTLFAVLLFGAMQLLATTSDAADSAESSARLEYVVGVSGMT